MLSRPFCRFLIFVMVCLGITALLPFQAAEAKPQYLPYGVPVPPDQPIPVPPKPYDPATDPPPIENTQPEKNLAKDPKYKDKLPKKARPPKKGLPTDYPGTGDAGFYINGDFASPTDSSGIYAGNDAQLNLVIPTSSRDITIYAPTHMPPNNSCLETTTVHVRRTNQNSTEHAHGFWNHCSGGVGGWNLPDGYEIMDAAWQAKYVRTFDGEQRYWTEIMPLGRGCWVGQLYNFNLGRWETKTSPAVCGTGPRADGWTIWESYGLSDNPATCYQFPNIRASAVQIYNGYTRSWQPVTPSISSFFNYGACFISGPYRFRTINPNYEWEGVTAQIGGPSVASP